VTARWLIAVLVVLAMAARATGHEVRPAYLEIEERGDETFDVLWKVPARGDRRLGLYVLMPETCELLGDRAGMFAGGAFLERWSVRHADSLVGETIHVDGLHATRTDVLVRVERADGTTQIARLTPTKPSFVVEASPTLSSLAWTYALLGVEHILLGVDHLLFVLALLLLVKGWGRLVATITAFTVAHSVTLAAATLGVVYVPGPPVEAVIALSIVFVAAEIVRSGQGRPGLAERLPWIIAFVFGLLHGLGFAGALREIGLPERAIPLSLLLFNVGVEIGQLLFIAVAALAAQALRRVRMDLPRQAALVPPYAIGAVAMFWVIERVVAF
jgi:hydrogenase/urease accessory protein HupE